MCFAAFGTVALTSGVVIGRLARADGRSFPIGVWPAILLGMLALVTGLLLSVLHFPVEDDLTDMGPPGWYDDPYSDGHLRHWDGRQWTERRAQKLPLSQSEPPTFSAQDP